jgi:hypothetical protein
MFRSDRLDYAHPHLAESAGRAYAHLVDCIAAIQDESNASSLNVGGAPISERTSLV